MLFLVNLTNCGYFSLTIAEFFVYYYLMSTLDRDFNGIGESEAYLEFQAKLSRVAKINRPVLLIGERGTGKEISARRIHYLSERWQGPLVTVNCASLPPSLIESELFGYEKGAFTGAVSTRKGRFEEAQGGTLFLDEIGLIPMEVQEKILRVVEYGTYERVGSSITHETDVRIVGATNADLKKMAEEGKFKQDLLDRLSFEVLFLPPLRKREGDIMLLADFFASKMAFECGLQEKPVFSDAAAEKLRNYMWPGNVRELKNVVERAVYRSGNGVIDDIDFDPFRNPYADASKEETAEGKVAAREFFYELKDFEKAEEDLDILFLSRALDQGKGNQKVAAESLNLTYDQFRGLYRKYKDRLK